MNGSVGNPDAHGYVTLLGPHFSGTRTKGNMELPLQSLFVRREADDPRP